MLSSRTAASAQRRMSFAMLFVYAALGYVVSLRLGQWALGELGLDPAHSNPIGIVCAGMCVIMLWPAVLVWRVAR